MATTYGTWRLVHRNPLLQRSSQTLSTLGKRALIFGGELHPREPRDNDVQILSTISKPNVWPLHTYGNGPSTSPENAGGLPLARVGTASAVVDGKIYYFSGRGGVDMAPIDEQGKLWQFCFSDAHGVGWQEISPADKSQPVPEPRSYHCMTSDGKTTLYVHDVEGNFGRHCIVLPLQNLVCRLSAELNRALMDACPRPWAARRAHLRANIQAPIRDTKHR